LQDTTRKKVSIDLPPDIPFFTVQIMLPAAMMKCQTQENALRWVDRFACEFGVSHAKCIEFVAGIISH
jgi:hypothetical protein